MTVRITRLLTFILVIFCLVSCDSGRPVLHVYNWADYIDPEAIVGFEKEHNCQVVIDNYDSNEAMYAKIKAGATGYDIIFPSGYMASIMEQQGMLHPIQKDLIPNLKSIDREILKHTTKDVEMSYSVPYMITAAGIGYDKTKIKDIELSWSVFDRQDLKGRITLLNDMRETIGAALKFLGYSLNTINEKELIEARDVVIRWKKNIAKMAVEDGKMGLGSGEFLLVHYYNGDIFQVMKENKNIAFFLPKEGFSITMDDMVIPKGAKQIELAHKFINFMTKPEICAQNMKYVRYYSPNADARKYIEKELLDNPAFCLTSELLAKAEVIDKVDKYWNLYTKIWDQIKAAE